MKRSPLAIIFVTVFIDLVGFGIILPLLPYYAESYGASATMVGLLSTSYSLMQFLFMPIWGRLSDRLGRRPMILLSLVGSSVGFLIFGLAQDLLLLFLGRMVAGIAGAIVPTTQAYIADITTPEQRAKGMGLIGAAFGLGFILGPAIGGQLSVYGYDKPFLFAAALAGANFVFAFFKLPESLKEENRLKARREGFNLERLKKALSQPLIPILLTIYFVVIFAFANMEATFGLLNMHAYDLSARGTSHLFTYIGILMCLMQGLAVGHLVRLFGEKRLIALGTFCMIFGLALMPYAPNIPVYCVIIALVAFGAGANNPSLNSLISRSSIPEDQGGVLGISQSLASLGRILGPAWGGYTFDVLGYHWPFVTGGIFMTIAFLLILRYVVFR
jgi:multidrug resistance protein